MFRILVGVKRVIDYAVRIRVTVTPSSSSSNSSSSSELVGGIEYNNVKHSMNPFDEIAVEEALKIKAKLLKEKPEMKVEVVVASIGPKAAGETLRTALAMGADRAIHVDLDTEFKNSNEIQNQLLPMSIAKIFEKLFHKEDVKIVLMGKQAIDDDSNATGQMLAGFLDIPQATFASKVEVNIDDGNVQVTREIDDGTEVIECSLPAVITTDLRLNEPRYATLPNIMKAKSKPVQIETISSLGLSEIIKSINDRAKIVKIIEPAKRNSGIKLNDVDELIEKLKSENAI